MDFLKVPQLESGKSKTRRLDLFLLPLLSMRSFPVVPLGLCTSVSQKTPWRLASIFIEVLWIPGFEFQLPSIKRWARCPPRALRPLSLACHPFPCVLHGEALTSSAHLTDSYLFFFFCLLQLIFLLTFRFWLRSSFGGQPPGTGSSCFSILWYIYCHQIGKTWPISMTLHIICFSFKLLPLNYTNLETSFQIFFLKLICFIQLFIYSVYSCWYLVICWELN